MKQNWKSITLSELAGLEMEGKEFIVDGDEQNIKVIPSRKQVYKDSEGYD